jgi:aminopeptidase N
MTKALFPLVAACWIHATSFAQEKLDFSHHYREIQTKAQQLLQRSAIPAAPQINYGYDAVFYHLQLKIFPAAREIEGNLLMEAKSETAGLATVPLDLYASMQIFGIGENAASFSRSGNVLNLTLNRTYQAGEKFRVAVQYRGQPEAGGFGAFTFREHSGMPIIASLSEPYFARLWWPCKDTPTDKADSVRVDITVPSGLTAVSNGVLESVRDDGEWKTFSWKERYPITTYLVSVAVTDYAEFGETFTFADGTSMPLVNYVYPERLNEAQIALADTRDMLAFFNSAFGDYPFKKEKYGHAQFAWGGGMEHQTITSLGGFSDGLVAHELAHQWWGDMITMKSWQDIWLNEGFASYSEALFVEHRDGKAAYRDYMRSMDRAFTGSVFVRDTTSASGIFNITVYDKGAWVLHTLRNEIGDSTFFRLLKSYAADPRFRFGNASTSDFKNLAEQISGKELDWFFEQWVYREGRPVLRYGWKWEGENLLLRMQQIQEGASYRLSFGLAAIAGQDTFRFAFEHAGGFQEYQFAAAKRIDRVLIDPDHWVLKTLQQTDFSAISADGTTVPQNFTLYPIYPNPFVVGEKPLTVNFLLRRTENVRVAVFNALGQETAALMENRLPPDNYEISWDGRTGSGEIAPAGIYFIRLQTATEQAVRKFVVVQ